MSTIAAKLVMPIWLGLLVGHGAGLSVERFEYGRPKMGTLVRIVLYATSRAEADRAAAAAYARVDQLNAILSDYDPGSEVSRLSAASRREVPTAPVRVSSELYCVLERSCVLATQTSGAFDVTVGPYIRLWRRARQQRMLPAPARLAEARRSVGYQNLRFDAKQRTVQLCARQMRLDLGGIAKGFVADEALQVLTQLGIARALVDAGGDLAVTAGPPGKPGWCVGLVPCQATPSTGEPWVHLAHRALATSGDTYRSFELDGKRYSHIVDPRTGLGLTHRLIVTVCAPDCMTADGVASAASVLGIEQAMALVERLPEVALRICDLQSDPPTTHVSRGFPIHHSLDHRPADRTSRSSGHHPLRPPGHHPSGGQPVPPIEACLANERGRWAAGWKE